MGRSFRNSAAFGKRIEYWTIGLMLKDNLDVFMPLVDDDGIDAILRGQNGSKIDLQIKARSNTVLFGDAALFAPLTHPEERKGYYFLFYSERMDCMWLMSSKDFIGIANQNKKGKNIGKRSIWFNGRNTKEKSEHAHPRFNPWCITANGKHDFSRLHSILKTGTDLLRSDQ